MISPLENTTNESEKSSDSTPETPGFREKVKASVRYVRLIILSLGTHERRVFFGLVLLFVVGVLGTLLTVNAMFIEIVPARGGSFTEGVVGTPRFLNPLLATSDADRDITALVYSGLLRPTTDGTLVNDLAENYIVSPDGLSYTFVLRDALRWHDGKPVTADDVVFTIKKVQDSTLKSPKLANWEGVDVAKTDNKTVVFTLKQPYAPFLENTTLGILPKHVWEKITPEQFAFSLYNINPIGSGPYRVEKIKRDSAGIPKYYELAPFKHFALGIPYIAKIHINFYPDEEHLLVALRKGGVEAVSAIPTFEAAKLREEGYRILNFLLPRVFGVFFNHNKNEIFTQKAVRQALEMALDKKKLVDNVLHGYGTPLEGPLPPGALGYIAPTEESSGDVEAAIALLEKNGWVLDKETGIRKRKGQALAFSLATSNAEELLLTAKALQSEWRGLGADVIIQTLPVNELNQNVIRPRTYDTLFFGEVIGRESDPFPFWHSSQRNDPGLNIALYTNITVDKLLEGARSTTDIEKRAEAYEKFQKEIASDSPAVFIYSPDFIYILPERIQGVERGTIALPSERFINIHQWFIETNREWVFFK
ncbi:MAG: peptide ABC transporter substrate-binding protein [Parcubacteria group bacterium]|nr:peptide ABC transporter substrate-binding protein [Parcubacteria group bacterium]